MFTFSHEVKDTLARLLATENLIVEHKQVPTASFDVQERILTLPMWQKASSTVYDLLVGHEVGHALYTPNLDWKEGEYVKVPPSFVNVIEDARIERMMKRKFPGFAKTFHKGYKELSDADFFCIADEDLSKMNLIDRINIHFKVGTFAAVPFAEDEKEFVSLTEGSETFADVLEISKLIFEFVKAKQEEQTKIEIPPAKSNQQGSPTNGDSIEVEAPNVDQNAPVGDSGGSSEGSEGASTGDKSVNSNDSSTELESRTDSVIEENKPKLIIYRIPSYA